MKDNETPELKETKRKEKAVAEEAKRVLKEQDRKKAFWSEKRLLKSLQKKKKPSERPSGLMRKPKKYPRIGREGKLLWTGSRQ